MIKILNYLPKKIFKDKLLKVYQSLNKTFLRKYLPLHSLYIEVTSCCNLACKGCYRNINNYESKNKHMSLESFQKYVDQVPNAHSLYLHGLGEPSLNPEIKEIIEYASRSNKFNNIAFTTNALAKDPEIYRELFLKGLTQITISVDSLDPQEVNEMRPFTDTDKLKENIKWIISNFPDKTKISMVVNKINFETFEKTLEDLYNLGVREMSFHPYEDFGYPFLYLSFDKKKKFLDKLKNSHIKEIIFYPSGFIPIQESCILPSTAPVINVRGYLIPCCRINDENIFHSGNLNEETFKKIFYSKEYIQLQKNMQKNIYPSFCKGCMGNPLEVERLLQDNTR